MCRPAVRPSAAPPLRRAAWLVVLLLSLLAPLSAAAQDDLCADLDTIAGGWDQMAVAIGEALEVGISQADAESFDQSIYEAATATEELAVSFQQTEGLEHWGRLMGKSLGQIRAEDDFGGVVRWIGRLVETLDAMIAECRAAGPGAGSPQPPAYQAPSKPTPSAPSTAPSNAPSNVPSAAAAGGTFRFVYEAAPSEDLAMLAGILQQSAIYEALAAIVHSTLVLPLDIPVVFTTCGVPNAFYQPEQRRIVMCYEFFDFFGQTLSGTVADDELGGAILDVGAFFLVHEIGHALVHVLDLPITGREEDAVDQLAALVLLDADEAGEAAVLSAVTQFEGSAALLEQHAAEMPFWDEHSLDAQRMYDLACLLYGSNPDAYAGFVGPDLLPAERAQRCPAEFQQKNEAWSRILAPYMAGG